MINRAHIRFAVVGLGRIGKRHCVMIQENPEAELIAVCDIEEEEGKEYVDEGLPFYLELKDMLKNEHFDVLSVATPNGLHQEHSLLALEHNHNLVIEKPMALHKEGCEEIIYKALQKHRLVFCVMQNRYSPPSLWLKEIVDSGQLGKIFFVHINCFWNRDESYYNQSKWKGSLDQDGGTLFTQFSHFIDIMYWIFGDINSIKAQVTSNKHDAYTEFEDSGALSFKFNRGGMGSLSFSTAVWNKNLESSIRIVAEKGSIIIGGQYMNEVLHCDIENYNFSGLEDNTVPNNYGDYKGSAANHHIFYQNVIATLRGNDSVTTNALEGMKVVEIIEKIYLAAKQNA